MAKSRTRAKADKAEIVGRKNLIINGGFDVWQRGTSFSSNDVYTADRWKINLSGSVGTVSRQEFSAGQTDVPNNPRYFMRTVITTANNNASNITRLEDVRLLSGQQVTLSFWAKGTNPPAGSFDTLARQSFGSGGSGPVDVVLGTGRQLTSNWQRFSSTVTLPSVAGKTIGSNDYTWFELVKQSSSDTGTSAWSVDIANVQLELGSVATDFEHRSYGEELALCQRYYQAHYTIASGVVNSPTAILGYCSLPTTMRSLPTLSTKSGGWTNINVEQVDTYDVSDVYIGHGINLPHDIADFSSFTVTVLTTNSRTTGDGACIMCDRNNDYFIFDAEV